MNDQISTDYAENVDIEYQKKLPAGTEQQPFISKLILQTDTTLAYLCCLL